MCARIGGASSTTMEPQSRRLTFHDSRTHPLEPRGTREAEVDDTRRTDPNPSQRVDARDAFAHEYMDDPETLALVGDGHTFGKKHGDCRERVFLQPISPQPSARSMRNDDQSLNM